MVAHVVFRTEKLKSQSAVSGAVGHNHRSRPTPNADSSRPVVELVGPPTEPVHQIIERITGKPPRSNAVLASESIISASPEYFRPDDPSMAGTWDEDRLQAWREAVEPWIQEQFPHAISVTLHLDEDTPHYQVIDLPIVDDGRGGLKLSHKAKYGGESRLDIGRWQTKSAEPVAHLGIERGIKGSTARHTKPRKYRGDAPPPVGSLEIAPPPLILRPSARASWAEGEGKRIKSILNPKIAQMRADAAGRKVAEDKERSAAARGAEAQQALRQERELLRDTPLADVFEAAGWHRDSKDSKQWISPGGKDSGRISVEGSKWYDHAAGHGSKGAIDLVMHVTESDFKQALGWLRDSFGLDDAAASYRAYEHQRATEIVEAAPPFDPPKPEPTGSPRLRKWLEEKRRLAADLVDRLIESGSVYASKHKGWLNSAWPFHRSDLGAEVKGITGKHNTNAPGSRGKLSGWVYETGPKPGRLVVSETPLDALSYHQLHPGEESVLVSTAGARAAPRQWLLDVRADHIGLPVVVAYDNDRAGRQYAPMLAKHLDGETAFPPKPFKDWNDAIPRPDTNGDEVGLEAAPSPSTGPGM